MKIRIDIPRFHVDIRKVIIERLQHLASIRKLLRTNPVVALLGARQVGKTTLAKALVEGSRSTKFSFFDLEDPEDLARLEDPMLALRDLRGTVVLDEIQRRPDLFPSLRVLADRPGTPCRFLVLGSASPQLLRQSSETLAGRIAFHELNGFSMSEVGATALDRLWLRGGFPRSFTARSDTESLTWRRNFIKTFLERDLPQLGVSTPATTMRRFWTMMAHYHGQIWNASELARALGANDKTARTYLHHLGATFVARSLRPWHENLKKRQVKAHTVYLSDSGLLHALLGLGTIHDLRGHPKVGASWEGMCIGEVTARLGAHDDETYFWHVHSGPELDLFVVRGKKRLGFEFKLTTAPAVTSSMESAMKYLRLTTLYVVHAGVESFPLGRRIEALSARQIWTQLKPL